MERDSQQPRMSRPISVRMMGERVPALGGTHRKSEPKGAPEPRHFLPSHSTADDTRDPVFIMRQNGEILFANCALMTVCSVCVRI